MHLRRPNLQCSPTHTVKNKSVCILCVCLSETYKTKCNLSSGQRQRSLRDALPKTFFLLLRTYLVIYLVKQGTKEKVFGWLVSFHQYFYHCSSFWEMYSCIWQFFMLFKSFVSWLAIAFAHVANETGYYYFTLCNPDWYFEEKKNAPPGQTAHFLTDSSPPCWKTSVSKLTSYSWRKRMINTDVGQTVQQWTRRRREKVSVFDDGTAAKLSAHLDLSKREKVFLFSWKP